MSLKVLVRLQRPPPVKTSFASGVLLASKMLICDNGSRRFRFIAQKQPAAPAPMIAIFLFLFKI